MEAKQLLIEQFIACYNEPNWFVPLTTAIDGLTAEHAAWKSRASNNSIWQITNHLIFWNRRYLNRFKSIPNPEVKGDNNTTFEGEMTSGSQSDWANTKKQLNDVMDEWKAALQEADNNTLGKIPKDLTEGVWYSYIALINIHNAYHTGQIVTIRKEQGSWDEAKGVN